MIKQKTKIAAICIFTLLMQFALPVSAETVPDNISEDELMFSTVSGDSVSVVGYSGAQAAMDKVLNIPAVTSDNKKIVSIGMAAFSCEETKETARLIFGDITIDSTNKLDIGDNAFAHTMTYGNPDTGTSGTFTIKGDVGTIGKDAFYNTIVYGSAFNCKNGIDEIKEEGFFKFKCAGNIMFGGDIGYIGKKAFGSIDDKKGLYFNGNIGTIEEDGFRSGIVCGNTTFSGNIENIGTNAFANISYKGMTTFSGDIANIGDNAFWKALIGKKNEDETFTRDVDIVFDGDIGTIGKNAFEGLICYGSLKFNGKIDKISDYAFKDLDVSGLKLNNVRELGTGVFFNAPVINIKGINGLEILGEKAFANCTRLKTVVLPDTVKSIGKNCFWECEQLESIKLPANPELVIGENAFPNQEGLTIEIPAGVKDISKYSFDGLDKVVFQIDENVANEVKAYLNDKELQFKVGENGKVQIGNPDDNLSGQEETAQEDNPPAEEETRTETDNSGDKPATTNTPSDEEQQTDKGQESAKKEEAVVGKTYTISGARYKVTGTNTASFVKLTNSKLKKLAIPAKVKILGKKYKVTQIEKRACYKHGKLASITVGNNVSKIGDEAFAECGRLKTLTLGTSVKTIGKKALLHDKALSKSTINSKKLDNVGANAFKGLKKHPYLKIYAPKGKGEKYTKLINKAK